MPPGSARWAKGARSLGERPDVQLSLSADQQAVASSFADFFRREVPTARVRRAEPLGFDRGLWRDLSPLGLMASPWAGAGVGRGLLAGRRPDRRAVRPPSRSRSVDRGLSGGEVVGALRTGPRRWSARFCARGRPTGDDGAAPRSIGCGGHGALGRGGRFGHRARRRPSPAAAGGPDGSPPGLGAEAPADVVIGDAASALELASGRRAVDLAGGARDDWRTLKSAALVGLAAEAVSLGIGYATQRQQFGRLIGSFQAWPTACSTSPPPSISPPARL